MKRKMICFILTAVMLLSLLSGCGKTPDETTNPTKPPYSGEVPNVVNGVYATCDNYDFTFYDGHNYKNLGFYLITEKPLPKDAYIVVNDITSTLNVHITDDTDLQGTKLLPDIYWFMKEPDKNWAHYMSEYQRLTAELKRLQGLAYGEEQVESEAPVVNQNALEQWKAVYEELCNLEENPYIDELAEWKRSDPEPFCYCYKVSVHVQKVTQREQLKSMELVAGDMSRTITMKNVWLDIFDRNQSAYTCPDVDLNAEWEFPTGDPNGDSSFIQDSFTDVFGDLPCSSDLFTSGDHVRRFVVKEDMLLKDMYIYGDNSRVKVEWVELLIMNSQNQVVNVKWTPGMEFRLRKGEKVAMQAYLSDPHTQQMNYYMVAMMVLEYECGGENKQWNLRFFIGQPFNAPEICLWAFKGLDIPSYYTGYYIPNQILKSSERGQR